MESQPPPPPPYRNNLYIITLINFENKFSQNQGGGCDPPSNHPPTLAPLVIALCYRSLY